MADMICPHCKGNGYVRLRFEGEEVTEQCWVCNSQGEVDDTKHFIQTWREDNGSSAYYYGPLLDPDSFKDHRIHKEKKV